MHLTTQQRTELQGEAEQNRELGNTHVHALPENIIYKYIYRVFLGITYRESGRPP